MKNQLLKAITEMPNIAAYWMGRRDTCAMEIEEALSIITVDDLEANQAELETNYLRFDQFNDNFSKKMGWL